MSTLKVKNIPSIDNDFKINEKFKSLINVSSVIVSTLDKRDVLKSILDQTKVLMCCNQSSVLLVDEEKDELYFDVCAEEKDYLKLKELRLKKGEGIAGSVWQSKESILLEDVRNDSRFSNKADMRLNNSTRSLIAAPLIINGQVIGVMEAINKIDADFDEVDKQVFETLANYASIAVYNSQLYEMAIKDGMTHLFTHKYFMRRLSEEFNRAYRYKRELSLLMIDIDNFKNFNDTYGHLFGDKVLIRVADAVSSFTRKSDVAARYGGEEFAIILPETDFDSAYKMGERIRNRIEKSIFLSENNPVSLTLSVGISSLQQNNPADYIELIKMADTALYSSKHAGKNRVTIFK